MYGNVNSKGTPSILKRSVGSQFGCRGDLKGKNYLSDHTENAAGPQVLGSTTDLNPATRTAPMSETAAKLEYGPMAAVRLPGSPGSCHGTRNRHYAPHTTFSVVPC